MRSAKLFFILLSLALLLSAGCVESKFKTRSQMTPEEINQIELVYHPVAEDGAIAIPPFLDNVDAAAFRVNGRDITASDLRELYHHFVTIQKLDPEMAKRRACESWIRSMATATHWPDTIEPTIVRLGEIRDQVNQGTVDFVSMIVENSQEPDAATNYGDLGTIRPGMNDPILEMHVFTDPIGQVCGPFPTTAGWQLTLVTERNDMGTDNPSAIAQSLLLVHGLDPENANQLNETNATRWANTANIEIFTDEVKSIINEIYPQTIEVLNQDGNTEANGSTVEEEVLPAPETESAG
jgi:hypothetical protein